MTNSKLFFTRIDHIQTRALIFRFVIVSASKTILYSMIVEDHSGYVRIIFQCHCILAFEYATYANDLNHFLVNINT